VTRSQRQTLFDAHLKWAEAIARSVKRTLPPSFEVADLEQEARHEMWKATRDYNQADPRGASFPTFAYQRVRGACLMSVRRRAYREATHGPLYDSAAIDHSSGQDAHQDKLRAVLLDAIGRLPSWLDRERRVLRLHYMAGMPLSDVAVKLKTTDSQAREMHERGLVALRRYLATQGMRPRHLEW